MATAAELAILFKVQGAGDVAKAAGTAAGKFGEVAREGKRAGEEVAAGAEKGAGGLGSMTEMAGKVVPALAAIAAAKAGFDLLTGAIGGTVNIAMDFEKRISAIAAVSGASATEMASVHDKALELGAATAYSASEAAAGMEELLKAGVNLGNVVEGGSEAMLNLAAAGGTEVSKAAEIMANSMNVFGMAGTDASHVADLIAGAANASAIGVEDFGYALAASGAVANLAGISFDDLSVAITAMGNAGIKGSDAGTSLKTFMSNLIPTTDKQIAVFKELGIVTSEATGQMVTGTRKASAISGELTTAMAGMSKAEKDAYLTAQFGAKARDESTGKMRSASELAKMAVRDNMDIARTQSQAYRDVNLLIDQQTGKFKPLGEVAGILNEKLKGLTQTQKMQALETMFGADAIRAAAIMADTGAEGFSDLAEQMGKVKATDVAATRLDNLAGVMDMLKGSIETAQIKIGEAFLPMLKDIALAANDLINGIDWDAIAGEIKKLIDKVDWKKFGDDVKTAFDTLMRVDWKAIIGDFGPFVDLAVAAGKAVLDIAKGAGLIKPPEAPRVGTTAEVGGGMEAGGMATRGRAPTRAPSVAVPQPVVPYQDRSAGERFGESIKQIGIDAEAAGKRNAEMVAGVKKDWAGLQGAAQGLQKRNSDMVNGVKSDWSGMQKGAQTLDANVRKSAGDMAAGVGKKAGEMADEAGRQNAEMVAATGRDWQKMQDDANRTWTNISTAAGDIWSNITTTIGDWAETAYLTVQGWWKALSTTTNAIFTGVSAFLQSAWTTISTTVGTLVAGLVAGVTTLWTNLSTSIGTITANIGAALSTAWATITSTVTSIVSGLIAGVTSLFTSLIGSLTGIMANVGTALQGAWTTITTTVTGLASAAVAAVTRVWGTLTATLGAVFSSVLATARTAWQTIQTTITGLATSIVANIGKTLGTVVGVVTGVFNSVLGAARSVWQNISSTIGGLISGMVGMVTERVQGVVGAFIAGIQGISGKLTTAWQTITSTLGGLVSGLAAGVRAKVDQLTSLGTDIVQGIEQGIKDAWNALIATFEGLIDLLPAAVKTILGIASPSKVFEEIGKWITEGLESGLKDRANEMGAIDAMRTILDAMVDITKNAVEIINELVGFEMPSDMKPLVQKFRDLTAALNEFGLALEDMAEYATDSTNDQYLWVKKLSQGEIDRINALMPALGSIAQFVGNLADSLDKVRDLDLTGIPDKFKEINDTLILPLADLATNIAALVINQTGPWATEVQDAAGALSAVSGLVDTVGKLDLSKAKALDAAGFEAVKANITALFNAIIGLYAPIQQFVGNARKAFLQDVQDFATVVSAAASLFEACAKDTREWAKTTNLSATTISTIETNIRDFYYGLVAVSKTFRETLDEDTQTALVEGAKRYADIASAGASLFEAAAVDTGKWVKTSNMSATLLSTIETNIGDFYAAAVSMSATFRAMKDEDQTKLHDGVQRWADMAKAATDLFVQAGGITVEWAKATKLPTGLIDTVLRPNVEAFLGAVQEMAVAFLAGYPDALKEGTTGETRGTFSAGIAAYVNMAKAAIDLFAQAGGLTVDWAKAVAIPAGLIDKVLRPNIEAFLAAVESMATAFLARFPAELKEGATGETRDTYAGGIKAYVDMAKAAVDMFAAAGGLTVDWAKAAEVPTSALDIVEGNVKAFLGRLRTMSRIFREAYQGDEGKDVLDAMKAYAETAKTAIDLFAAAGGLTIDWKKVAELTAGNLDLLEGNIRLILGRMRTLSASLTRSGYTPEKLDEIKTIVEAIVAPIKAFADAANAINDLDTSKLITVRFIERVRDNMSLILGLLTGGNVGSGTAIGGGLFADIEEETAKAWTAAATAIGAAAEAMGKVGDLVTGFMENPFMRAKQMRNGTWRLGDWTPAGLQNLRDRITLSIKESIKAIAAAWTDPEVQDALAAATATLSDDFLKQLNALLDVYLKVIDVITKFDGVKVPDLTPLAGALVTLLSGVNAGGGSGTHGVKGEGDAGVTGGGGGGAMYASVTANIQLGAQTLETIFQQAIGEWSRAQTFDTPGA